MTTTSHTSPRGTKPFTSLVRIYPAQNIRPRYNNGEYLTCNHVDLNYMEMLEYMFTNHRLISIEPCLEPYSGEQYADLYLVTFEDCDAYLEGKKEWSVFRLNENPFIKSITMSSIKEDDKLPKALPEKSPMIKESKLQEPSNIFEEWWAMEDSPHWEGHQERINDQDLVRGKGVWLYRSFPGERHHRNDRTSFSRVKPASLEYNVRGRQEEGEPIIESIDWSATRKTKRLSFIPNQTTFPWFQSGLQRAVAATSPQSSDSEDDKDFKAKGDTPRTSPSDSPSRHQHFLGKTEVRLGHPTSRGITSLSTDWTIVSKYSEVALVDSIRPKFIDKCQFTKWMAAVGEEVLDSSPSSTPRSGRSALSRNATNTNHTTHTSTPEEGKHPVLLTLSTEDSTASPSPIATDVGYRYPHFSRNSSASNVSDGEEYASMHMDINDEGCTSSTIYVEKEEHASVSSDGDDDHTAASVDDKTQNEDRTSPIIQEEEEDHTSTSSNGDNNQTSVCVNGKDQEENRTSPITHAEEEDHAPTTSNGDDSQSPTCIGCNNKNEQSSDSGDSELDEESDVCVRKTGEPEVLASRNGPDLWLKLLLLPILVYLLLNFLSNLLQQPIILAIAVATGLRAIGNIEDLSFPTCIDENPVQLEMKMPIKSAMETGLGLD
ncbi:hypothetical protein GQ44DRAFT_828712 [Phaeosphaeriaceae sp. PMI808]|nr:hypothetical protein GQ44DRAFT_828712 [Phaeosphaeriaceae sp. PMI808]